MIMSAKGLREEIQAMNDRGQAIVAKAQREQRDFTPAELNEIESIYGGMDETGGGKIGELQRKLEPLAAMEQHGKVQAAAKALADGLGGGRAATRSRNLKAFDRPEDAYAFGMGVKGFLMGDAHAQQWCQQHGIQAAHRTTSNPAGGFIVPEPLRDAMIRLVEERGVFRRNSMNWPMSSGTEKVPRRAGGLTSYFVGETATITPSDMTFDQVQLSAKKQAILTAVTSEINEDNIVALGDLLATEIAYAFADKEDECGFNGDGTSTYGGITGLKSALQAGAIHDAASGNDSAKTLDLTDFEDCVGKLAQYPGMTPKWYVHSAVYWASMARLMDAAGGNTSENFGNGPQRSFLGYPVEFCQVLPATTTTLASTILCYFGDLNMATTLGTRRDMTIATDAGLYFAEDMIAIRGTARFDIVVHDRGDADSAGSIVALKTAA